MSSEWLKPGYHWDLHCERDRLHDAGTFTGGGWKIEFHTTESKWNTVDQMRDVLAAKNAAPHFVIGGRPGVVHPVVIQTVPLDRAGRANANDQSDGFQTNRANVIQIEVCAFTRDIPDWTMAQYKALANLVTLIRHRVPVPNRAPQDFSDPRRMGDAEWVKAAGYVDHRMCPDNDHVDGFRMREGLLIDLVGRMPAGGWAL